MGTAASASLSFRSFWNIYMTRFSFAFLGTGLILVWIQCILYARYIWVDNGATTIAINFSRCACILIVGAIVLHHPFTPKSERVWGLISVGMMTIGSLLFFYEQTTQAGVLTLLASILSGCGLAWGGGIWINFYARLAIREALLCAFLSLSFSTIIGIGIGTMPQDFAYFISMIIPIVTYIMYLQAQRTLDERPDTPTLRHTAEENVYDREPKSTFVRLTVGIALFSFVLGVSRGFPFGPSIELPTALQIVQHLGVAAAGLFIVWWVLIRQRSFRFSFLWQLQLASLAVGVLLLATLDQTLGLFGATLIAITNLFQVAFLWFLSYDAARFRSNPPYMVLGYFWIIHLFFREAGRFLMLIIGPSQTVGQTLIIATMVCLLAISMGFLLTDNIPHNRPFFSDICLCKKGRAALTASQTAAPVPEENILEKDECLTWLRDAFGLTQREIEVAQYLSQGRTSPYIASKLFLSNETVRSYTKAIYAKTSVHSKQEFMDLFDQPRLP